MNGGEPEGCELARQAMVRSTDALDASRAVYEALGQLTREVAGMRTEMREGFRSLAGRVRDVRKEARAAMDSVDDLEDTQVRNLKEALAKAHDETTRWKWWVLGIVAGVAIAAAAALLGFHK
jgi:hypothetical protein